jgi:hypothetical protein
MDLLGFAVGDEVKIYCLKGDGGAWILKGMFSDHAQITQDGGWFLLEGVIADLNGERISVDVDGRDSPVTCGVMPGADLSGFAVGDEVSMKCKLIEGSFELKLLESETARYELIT